MRRCRFSALQMLSFKTVLLGCMICCAVTFEHKPCSQEAKKFSGMGLMGGWHSMDVANDAKSAREMTQLLQNSLSSKDGVTLDGNSQVKEVYTQVVNGVNYCMRFQASQTGNCKPGQVCQSKPVTCDAKIWVQAVMVQGQPQSELSHLICN